MVNSDTASVFSSIPKGMIQIGVYVPVNGDGIPPEIIDDNRKLGYTCIMHEGYLLICKEHKGRKGH